jgi:hypothetical protein
MHRGAFREGVFDVDADAIALGDLNRGARRGAVIAPDLDGLEGNDSLFEGSGFETEDSYRAVEFKGEIGNIRTEHQDGGFWRGNGAAGILVSRWSGNFRRERYVKAE